MADTDARNAYMQVLDTVRTTYTATDDQLRQLTPHITSGDGVALIRAGAPVALPAISVRGAFWRIAMKDDQAFVLPWRTNGSFRHQSALHARFPMRDESTLFVGEALAHGQEQWGDYLALDVYPSSAKIELRDLYAPDEGGKLVATAYAWLTSSMMAFENLMPAAVQAQEFGAALTSITTNAVSGLERCGWWPAVIQYCAYCGCYLSFTQCPGCLRYFSRQHSQMSVLQLFMPPAIMAVFRGTGHVFTVNPQDWLRPQA